MARRRKPTWDSTSVRALRRHLGLTQQELAEELSMRQQTVSEWETGQYVPRGASAALLQIIADRADFSCEAASGEEENR
jgi:DNA-binding transcriptional regulator YiaG